MKKLHLLFTFFAGFIDIAYGSMPNSVYMVNTSKDYNMEVHYKFCHDGVGGKYVCDQDHIVLIKSGKNNHGENYVRNKDPRIDNFIIVNQVLEKNERGEIVSKGMYHGGQCKIVFGVNDYPLQTIMKFDDMGQSPMITCQNYYQLEY